MAITTIEASAATGLTEETLAKLNGVPLAAFLERQRWFSTKHDPRSATLSEIVSLFPKYDAVFAQVEVKERHGNGTATYLLPIALVDKVDAGASYAIAKLSHGELYLVDAAHDPGFRAALLDYLVHGHAFGSDGAQLRFTHHGELELPRNTPSRVLSGEQSNTSIVYGDTLIVKLFRKLTPGENPDIEIGALLTERGSQVVPALVGSATLDGDRGRTALAMAQRLVPGARDLWSYVTEQLKALCAESDSAPFIADAETLGRTTRELHEALASVTDQRAFAPARATHDDVVRWCSAIRRELQDTVALLSRTNLPHGDRNAPPSREQIIAQGVADIEARDAVLGDIAALENDAGLDAGLTIRHHGDYHLGQVLRDQEGRLYIIDFEGEPSRPLAERRALHSPLRDVAGMLRSFGYAACIAASTCATSPGGLAWTEALERSRVWERTACDAFLRGYLTTASTTLPASDETTQRLIRLFAIEKAFYELRYELAYRRDWIWVPMRGISALIHA